MHTALKPGRDSSPPHDFNANRPRPVFQYSNMAQRLLGQTSIFGIVFFVNCKFLKSLLGIERQMKL